MKTVFRKVMTDLRTVYTDSWFLSDENLSATLETWYNALCDLTYDQLREAISEYISMNDKPPTPSRIRELAYKLKDGQNAGSITDTFILWSVTDKVTGKRVCQDTLADSRFSNLDILKDVKEKVGDGDYIGRRIG